MFLNTDYRGLADRIMRLALWTMALVVVGAAALADGPWLSLGLAAFGLAAAATIVMHVPRIGAVARLISAASLMPSVSLLVAALAGHRWQIDVHMAYFAALAILVVYCDWRVIAVGAAVVAVHHLLLSVVLPAAVFPGGGDLQRVILHAVILIVEAAVLIAVAANIQRLFALSSASLVEASAAREQADKASQVVSAHKNDLAEKLSEAERAFEARGRDQAELVAHLAIALKAVADGDLSARLHQDVSAEYERVRSDFNTAIGQLQATIQTIAGSAHGIRSGTGQMTQAADDLSRRSEQQAASLEETAAALDEITATVRKTAEGANHAREVVVTARGDAEQSGDVVRRAVAAMVEIERSAAQISQIIGVIDEIAFQTNLLALNAGVEAARAGDAGRGFAVVASEVRALAQRSGQAAKEIKTLISASGRQVQSGVDLVGQTGQALTRLASQVADIDAVVSEIAASAKEQATGLAEVNTAINQMDQVTQQNATMVERSGAASHALSQEAETLARLVQQFQTAAAPAGQVMPFRGAIQRASAPTIARPAAAREGRSLTRGNLALKDAESDREGWDKF